MFSSIRSHYFNFFFAEFFFFLFICCVGRFGVSFKFPMLTFLYNLFPRRSFFGKILEFYMLTTPIISCCQITTWSFNLTRFVNLIKLIAITRMRLPRSCT
jgi:hypothetical protein